MSLDSSVAAVVMGAAASLGAATARALAAKGVKVAIFDLNAEAGEAYAAEIGGVFCAVNVTDDASVDAGFAKAREAHGQERCWSTARASLRRPRRRAGTAKPASPGPTTSACSRRRSRSILSARSAASPSCRRG